MKPFSLFLLVFLTILLPAQSQDAGASRFVRGTAAAEGSARTTRQARVQLDESTRTLIITTDAATNEQVRQIIEALDKPVPQALIKVLFLEVTHSDGLDYGVDFTHDRTEPDGDRSIISQLFGVASETQGGIVTVLQNDLDITLRAIADVGKLNVLSRPSVLARNNEEATITIGQEVPFIRNSRITEDGQTINTVEYEDIGIILTVTPHIGANGLIELDVAPEISTLTGDSVSISAGVTAPVFAKRSAETHVVVPSGRTVVIGGLMEDQETVNVRKIPILGDLPFVGGFFSRKITETSKTELLIFLSPTVVESGTQLVELSERERNDNKLIQRETDPDKLKQYMGDSTTN